MNQRLEKIQKEKQKKVIRFFYLVLIAFVSFSCTIKNNVIKSNYTIQNAEYFILKEEYNKALKFYKKAYSNNKFWTANNCFTAAQVAAVLDDEVFFLKSIKSGMDKGLEPVFFYNDTILNDYIKSNNLGLKIEKRFIKSKDKYNSNINKPLNDSIIKLSQLDNKWKIHYLDSLANIDSLNKDKYSKKYDSIVKDIVDNHLVKLIKIHGYPYFNVLLEHNGNSYGNNRAKLILLHYYSMPKSCDFNDLLKNEVFKGNLPAEQFAEIMDFQAKYGSEEFCKVGFYNEWHIHNDSLMNDEINRRRKEIGLREYNEKIKKFERGKQICREIRLRKIYKHIRLFYWCG